MIIDNFLLFTGTSNGASGAPSIGTTTDRPTTGATQASSNIIDLHMAGLPTLANLSGARDIGIGDDPALKILVVVTTAISGGTSLTLSLQGATDNGSGAPNAFSTWWTSPAYSDPIAAGSRLMDMDFPRPPQGVAMPRFLQLLYINSGTHNAGAMWGAIIIDRHDQIYQSTSNAVLGGYPPGITISN